MVRDTLTFRAALWMSDQGRHLKAGEYRFDRAMTPFEVIDKIARGDVFVISVTFPEGLTIAEMAKIFESHGLGTAASFVQAAQDPAPIHDARSGGEGSRGLSVSGDLRAAAPHRRREAGAADGRALREGVDAGAAAGGRRAQR